MKYTSQSATLRSHIIFCSFLSEFDWCFLLPYLDTFWMLTVLLNILAQKLVRFLDSKFIWDLIKLFRFSTKLNWTLSSSDISLQIIFSDILKINLDRLPADDCFSFFGFFLFLLLLLFPFEAVGDDSSQTPK